MSSRKNGFSLTALIITATLVVTGCSTDREVKTAKTLPLVVTTSAITADLAMKIGGNSINVQLLVPNGFDSHTYEPKPSELALLTDADLIILPDITLNGAITGLIELSGDKDRVLDLNAAALSNTDLIYREIGNKFSANPHSWTSPVLVSKWILPLAERISKLEGIDEESIEINLNTLLEQIRSLDAEIRTSLESINPEQRKLIVYHDAWEYFGREYDIPVIGAIQAVSFAEPSAGELAEMVEQIRREKVKAFFGSEVFPSDVLLALESESGAKYIPDLADDRLPGKQGEDQYSYVGMMRENLALIIQGLK